MLKIVIDPNNPSGETRISKSQAPYIIFDRAYNWPLYVDNSSTPTSMETNHITVYTISKALGMGGLRLGWAFINDNDLFLEIKRDLLVIGICPNSFGMEAAENIFNMLISGTDLLNSYCVDLKAKINSRHKLLSSCPQFIITNDHGPYAWIKSNDRTDIEVFFMEKYKIKVYSGTLFGSTSEYARFSLICSDNDFNEAILRLTELDNDKKRYQK